MKTLFQQIVDPNVDDLQEQREWIEKQKCTIKHLKDILNQGDKTKESIIKLIFEELIKKDLLDEKTDWKELLLLNQEEVEWLDIGGLDYTLLNDKKCGKLVEANKRVLFRENFKNYIFDIDTGEYALFNDVEEKYNK